MKVENAIRIKNNSRNNSKTTIKTNVINKNKEKDRATNKEVELVADGIEDK